jgi:hypothetical protein
MSLQRVLENWSDYDNRMIRDGRDGRFFSCNEEWEVAYLREKISREYPTLTTAKILEAIRSCCEVVPAPRPRRNFVECVLRRLGLL